MSFIRPEPVIDIQYVVVILVVVTVIVHRLAWFRQNASRVECRLIFELWVADPVGIDDVGGQLPQRLKFDISSSHANPIK